MMRDVREIIREEMYWQEHILALLSRQALTVPELADALGRPSPEVMFWVMGLRRFGRLVEDELTEDGYYKYRAAGEGA